MCLPLWTIDWLPGSAQSPQWLATPTRCRHEYTRETCLTESVAKRLRNYC